MGGMAQFVGDQAPVSDGSAARGQVLTKAPLLAVGAGSCSAIMVGTVYRYGRRVSS
jgi:hypothetical protein